MSSQLVFASQDNHSSLIGRYVLLRAAQGFQGLKTYRSYQCSKLASLRVFSFPSLHHFLYLRNKKLYQLLFSKDLKKYQLYQSLLFKTFFHFWRKLFRRFTEKEPFFSAFFLVFYAFLGQTSLFYWHTWLRFLKISPTKRILSLNLLYPKLYCHRGFQIYEGFYLLSRISYRYARLSPLLFKIQMIFYQFHRWHLLNPILFPLRSLFVFAFLMLAFFAFLFPSLNPFVWMLLRKMKAFDRWMPSWLLCGSVSVLSFVFLALCRNKREQILFLSFLALWNCYPPYAKVCFFDVGQGDSTLISLPFQARNYLFDTGRAFAYPSLKRDLYAEGIRKLDALIISHDDLDHCENKEVMMQDFHVDTLIESKMPRYEIFDILLADKNFEDPNENSLILSFSLWNWRFLMTGDAYRRQEEMLLRRGLSQYDVLKLGHHGSKTSSSYQFLAQTQARFGIVSASSRFYQHPHPEVMASLRSLNIQALLTEREGSICFYLWPKLGIIKTNSGGFAIIWKGEGYD